MPGSTASRQIKLYSRRYKWGVLTLRADWLNGESTIWAFINGYVKVTPFQVSDFTSWKRAITGVNQWLRKAKECK